MSSAQVISSAPAFEQTFNRRPQVARRQTDQQKSSDRKENPRRTQQRKLQQTKTNKAKVAPITEGTTKQALPFVVSSSLIDVGFQGVKTAEAARPTLKTFNMAKCFSDLARETDLRRTLRHKWSMMLTPAKPVEEKASVAAYMSELKESALVNSIPEFCEAWNRNYLEGDKPFSKIVVFKKGIKPVWEDPDNKKGGRFVIRGATMEETLSMFVVIVARLMTGRLQSDYNDICGAVLQAKGSDQLWIQIWNKDAGDADQINRVKIFLNRLTTRTIAYQVHDLSLKMAKSRQNQPQQEEKEQAASEEVNTVPQEQVDDFVKDFLAAV